MKIWRYLLMIILNIGLYWPETFRNNIFEASKKNLLKYLDGSIITWALRTEVLYSSGVVCPAGVAVRSGPIWRPHSQWDRTKVIQFSQNENWIQPWTEEQQKTDTECKQWTLRTPVMTDKHQQINGAQPTIGQDTGSSHPMAAPHSCNHGDVIRGLALAGWTIKVWWRTSNKRSWTARPLASMLK